MLFPPALMSHPSSLPRICIAMGFSDAQKLLENARREVNAGESFFEFRLDYLPAPEQGIAVIRKFLAAHPDCSHPGHLPPPSEPRKIQRQRGGSDSHSGCRAGRRRSRGGHRNRKRRECHPAPGSAARQRPAAAFLPQLRWHAVARGGVAPHAAHFRRRLQDRHHGAQAFR